MQFCVAIALSTTAMAQTMNTHTSKPSKADQTFLIEAIEGDLAEINMGKLAQEKGQSREAKQFGQMLEEDHRQHLQKAKDTAQQMGLMPPAEPNAKQKKMYDQLSRFCPADHSDPAKAPADCGITDWPKDLAALIEE